MEGDQQDVTGVSPPSEEKVPGTAPDAVQRLAASRGFGDLVDVRHEISAKRTLLKGCATIVGSVVLIGVVAAIGEQIPDSTSPFTLTNNVFRFMLLFLLFYIIFGIAQVLRGLLAGSRSHYLYAGGLVHNRRGGPLAVAWPEFAVLTGVYKRHGDMGTGKILGYRVVP